MTIPSVICDLNGLLDMIDIDVMTLRPIDDDYSSEGSFFTII